MTAIGGARTYAARAEFRRRDRAAPWVIAGVVVDGRFWPANDGVEPVRGRLPDAGLLGWSELPGPVVATDAATAARVALQLARAAWPARAGRRVPWASGMAERG